MASFLTRFAPVFFSVFLSNAYADIEQAHQFFQNKDYAAALKEYLPPARAGDAIAQTRLGLMYANGIGIAKDFDEARAWFEKAAHQNNAEAQYWYATFILNDYRSRHPEQPLPRAGDVIRADGKPRDVQSQLAQQAIPWFEMSAMQGNVDAQSSLATLYMIGRGAPVDYEKAYKWNKEAAQRGHTVAMYNLGQLYEKGKGVEENIAESLYWYERAAKRGHVHSQFEMGVAFEIGLANYPKNEEKATQWYEMAANQGNLTAQFKLAKIFSVRDSAQIDKAFFWANKAASQNDKKSRMLLAQLYLDRSGDTKGMEKGLAMLTKLARESYAPAQELLGETYYNQKNQELAHQWWEKAAKNGNKAGLIRYAEKYYRGNEVPSNQLLATEYYLKALDLKPGYENDNIFEALSSIYSAGKNQKPDSREAYFLINELALAGDPAAVGFMGRYYASGKQGGRPDRERASVWYEKLAGKGDVDAQRRLGYLYSGFQGDSYDIANVSEVPDYQTACQWFRKAAEANDQDGQLRLAELYANGLGVKADDQESEKWLIRSAEQGYYKAQYALATLYWKDLNSRKEAVSLFKKVASYGYKQSYSEYLLESAVHLAEAYEKGVGVESNQEIAYQWYSLALETAMPESHKLSDDVVFKANGAWMGVIISERKKEIFRKKLHALEQGIPEGGVQKAKLALTHWKVAQTKYHFDIDKEN